MQRLSRDGHRGKMPKFATFLRVQVCGRNASLSPQRYVLGMIRLDYFRGSIAELPHTKELAPVKGRKQAQTGTFEGSRAAPTRPDVDPDIFVERKATHTMRWDVCKGHLENAFSPPNPPSSLLPSHWNRKSAKNQCFHRKKATISVLTVTFGGWCVVRPRTPLSNNPVRRYTN